MKMTFIAISVGLLILNAMIASVVFWKWVVSQII
jgi:hypothetical protein